MTKISYNGYRFPREIIQHAIWVYVRFTLTFRNLEEERSYETVQRWVNHFGPKIAADLRRRRPKPHTTWHVYLKINGRMVYLWRAVDAEGEVLDVLVQTKTNRQAALKLMRKLLRKYGFVTDKLVTNNLRSYAAAVGLVHQLMEARDARRLLKLQSPLLNCSSLTNLANFQTDTGGIGTFAKYRLWSGRCGSATTELRH